MADGQVEYDVRANTENLDSDLDNANEKAKKGAGKLSEVATGTAKAVGASFAAVGTAAVGVGAMAISSANDLDKAMNGFAASTGLAEDGLSGYEDVLKSIYANNYGESFEDIADNMALVKQQMGELSDTDLQKVVESAYLLNDTFEIDMQESMRGAQSMMDQFGVSAEEAYNLIAQGAQNGLNQNGDLADQLAEYSVYYADMGFSAEEMMNKLSSGAANGTFQIDYLNDAMKEFGIRSKDGSDTSKAAFKSLGLDADAMTAKFAAGGADAKAAFAQVTDALAGVENDVDRNAIGVSLFGTKWEDLGEDAVLALTSLTGEIDSTNDALGEMEDVKYDDLGSMFEGLKRSAELLLIPLGEKLIPFLSDLIEEVLPLLEGNLEPLIDSVMEFLPPLMDLAESLLPVIIDLFNVLAPIFADLMGAILPVLTDAFNQLLPPIMEIIQQLLPPLMDLFTALMPIILEIATALLPPLVDIFKALMPPILDLIDVLLPPLMDLLDALKPLIDALTPVIAMLASMFADNLKSAIDAIGPIIDNFMDYLKNIISFITNVFEGDWEGAWEDIKNIFKNVFNQIPIVIESVLNSAIGGINKLIKSINKVSSKVGIDAIPEIGEVSLPRFHTGGIVEFQGEMPALLQGGEMVLTKAQQAQLFKLATGEMQNKPQVPNYQALEDTITNANISSNVVNKQAVKVKIPLVLEKRVVGEASTEFSIDQKSRDGGW